MKWTEQKIAKLISRDFYQDKHIMFIPNCHWAGYEADVLCLNKNMKLIEFEIKTSRADFKADKKKSKWIEWYFCKTAKKTLTRPASHPRNIWKHYYLIPKSICYDGMENDMASPASGILQLNDDEFDNLRVACSKQAQPNKDARVVSQSDLFSLTRLVSLKMWSYYEKWNNLGVYNEQ